MTEKKNKTIDILNQADTVICKHTGLEVLIVRTFNLFEKKYFVLKHINDSSDKTIAVAEGELSFKYDRQEYSNAVRWIKPVIKKNKKTLQI